MRRVVPFDLRQCLPQQSASCRSNESADPKVVPPTSGRRPNATPVVTRSIERTHCRRADKIEPHGGAAPLSNICHPSAIRGADYPPLAQVHDRPRNRGNSIPGPSSGADRGQISGPQPGSGGGSVPDRRPWRNRSTRATVTFLVPADTRQEPRGHRVTWHSRTLRRSAACPRRSGRKSPRARSTVI